MTTVTFPNWTAIRYHLKTDTQFPYADIFKEDGNYGRREVAEKIGKDLACKTIEYPQDVRIQVILSMHDANALTGHAIDDVIVDSTVQSLARLAKDESDMRAARRAA